MSNAELSERFAALGKPEVIGKFESRTGILRRFYAPDDWATSDLAVRAAEKALARAGRKPEDVDLIILGTDSPDYITPATSVVVQDKLGAKRAGTFDIGCACASFPTALATASGLIATNPALRTVLVIGAYMMQRLADPEDPVVFFYGDGAGAVVIEPSDEPGFVGTAMQADGAFRSAWNILAGGTAEPASEEAVRAGRTQVHMHEKYPAFINDDGWPRLLRRLAEENEFSFDQVSQFLFTQVSKPTIEKVMGIIEQPVEKAHLIMHEAGYTGSACIPMAFDSALQAGKIHEGDLVVFIGSGVGYNQCATAFRIHGLAPSA
ncbi:3-oxoacyl-ACP synthase III family protein [Haliangium ochraceum]|uniref:3-oxoacyl-ACP synthase III family protein n=1 Tax=Haliangium ochraceum TaxID=80816 RepID=UPI00019B9835|nr:ketoacyl-ACP synthase III [Haliangium ochraceum]